MNYRAVYQILIDHAGARAGEDEVNSFVWAFEKGKFPCNEYRFQGTLGFGGKYYRDNRVACYPEDRTPARDATITKVNELLKELQVDDVSGK